MQPAQRCLLAVVAVVLAASGPASAAGPLGADPGAWTVKGLTGSYAVSMAITDVLGGAATAHGPYTDSGTWRATGATVTPIAGTDDLSALTGTDLLPGLLAVGGDVPFAAVVIGLAGPAKATFPAVDIADSVSCPANEATFDWGSEEGRLVVLLYQSARGTWFLASPSNTFGKAGPTEPFDTGAGVVQVPCPDDYSAMGGGKGGAPIDIVGNAAAAPDDMQQILNTSSPLGSVASVETGAVQAGAREVRLTSKATLDVAGNAPFGAGSGAGTIAWNLAVDLVRGASASLPTLCSATVTSVSATGATVTHPSGATQPLSAGTPLGQLDRVDAQGAAIAFRAPTGTGSLSSDGRLTLFPGPMCTRYALQWGTLRLRVPAGHVAAVRAPNASVTALRAPAAFSVATRRVHGAITDIRVTHGAVRVARHGRARVLRAPASLTIAG